jgi:hypothetical protein
MEWSRKERRCRLLKQKWDKMIEELKGSDVEKG